MTVPQLAPLFEPLRLRSGATLANRLAMAPMPTFAAMPDGSASEAERDYYRRRASGGVAAVVTAGCAVSSDALAFEGQWRADAPGDGLQLVAESIQSAGVLGVLQLGHAGDLAAAGAPALQDFAAAARRGAEAGFDAIEIHGGHRELLHQALASGRGDYCLDVVNAVAEAGLPVWYRVDPEDRDRLDLNVVRTFLEQAESKLDVLDVAASKYFAGSIRDAADRRPRAAVLARQFPSLAVMAVGGVSTGEQAAQALTDGCALVGLGHVLLAAPDLVKRWSRGESPTRDQPPSSDTLRAAAVPEPVIQYLLRKDRARR